MAPLIPNRPPLEPDNTGCRRSLGQAAEKAALLITHDHIATNARPSTRMSFSSLDQHGSVVLAAEEAGPRGEEILLGHTREV
jgi:hypothetical protein